MTSATCYQRVRLYNTAVRSYSPRYRTFLTMTFTSTSDPSRIFTKDGELKPGIYQIQSLYNQTFLDIKEHSREIYCRSVQSPREAGGLVRRYPSPIIHP